VVHVHVSLSCRYLLVLLRLLHAFNFHDRLNVITKTLQVALGDLLHFLIVFLSVTVLYVFDRCVGMLCGVYCLLHGALSGK